MEILILRGLHHDFQREIHEFSSIPIEQTLKPKSFFHSATTEWLLHPCVAETEVLVIWRTNKLRDDFIFNCMTNYKLFLLLKNEFDSVQIF